MRVLHVTPYFAPAWTYGGPPRSILGLCRALQRASIDTRVVTTTANGRDDLPPEPRGAVYGTVHVRYCQRTFPRVLWNARGLREAIENEVEAATLVHLHGLWHIPGWVAASVCRRVRAPYIISPRGMLTAAARARHAGRKRLVSAIQMRDVRLAALIHATSPAEAEALTAFVDGSRIRIVPNGVELPPDNPPAVDVRASAGIANADPIVLFLGRIHPIKRIDLIAGAVAAIRRDHPRARLVLAGPDESGTLAALQPALAQLGDTVHVVGVVDDAHKWAWLRTSAALVCCSDSENFGLSVAEAMAARLPVVVTRTCPWADVERAGAGYWVRQDAPSIADALRAVLADPDRARTMGERGRRLVEHAYSWAAVGRSMVELYEEVVRARARAIA